MLFNGKKKKEIMTILIFFLVIHGPDNSARTAGILTSLISKKRISRLV